MKLVYDLINRFLFIEIFLLFLIPIFSQAHNNDNSIYYLEDKDSVFQVDDLSSFKFSDELNISGFSNSTWWVKLEIKKSKENKPILVLEYPLLDHVNFYYKKENLWNQIETGDNLRFASRKIENKNFVFFLEDNIESPIYLKIKTEGPVFIPLKWMTHAEYTSLLNRDNYLWGIYFGIALIFIFYNLISFYSIKDRSYLFYVFHISAFTTLQAVLNGIAFEFFWPDFPYFANISPNFFHALSLFSVLFFSIQFLRLSEYLPLFSKLFKILAGVYFSFLFISFYTPTYKYLLIVQTYLIIFTSLLSLTTAAFSIKNGFSTAKYYMAGWVMLFLAIIANRLKALGYLPNNFLSTYGMLFASLLEMGLFSIALGFRIMDIRRQKEEAEREKQKLISDLHDNLGGDLTDIVYYLNKFVAKQEITTNQLETLRIASEKALNTLKVRIRSTEDIMLLEENFIDAIRLHLITRYSNTGRPLKTFVAKQAEIFSEGDNITSSQYNEIFLICKEVCTNDLKYGFGESKWKFDLFGDIFSIDFATKTNYTNSINPGQGTNNLTKRSEKIGAKIQIDINESIFNFHFEMNVNYSTLVNF